MITGIVSFICYKILGLVFIISGLTKAMDVFAFSSKIREYSLIININFSNSIYELIGILIIGLELFLGLLILNGVRQLFTCYVSILIICIFSIVLCYIVFIGEYVDCGCFGSLIYMSPKDSIIKNIILLIIAIIAIPYSKRNRIGELSLQKRTSPYIVILFCFTLLLNQPLIDSNLYKINSTLFINKSSKESIDVDLDIIPAITEFKRIYVIKHLSSTNAQNFLLTIKKYNTPSSLLLTSDNTHIPTLNNIFRGIMDNTEINKLISSDFGIIDVENNIIKNKWQQDYLHLQKPANRYDLKEKIYKYIHYLSWLALLMIILGSILCNIFFNHNNSYI